MLPLSLIKTFTSRYWLTGEIVLLCFVTNYPTQAQIVPDATLPVNSTVTPSGNTNIIEGGTTAGGNLFHSFREFSIPTGVEAFFNNAVDIQNIFTRVTGGNISNIDGLIRANGTANLFLLNPNGIVFGSNARLDMRGSFLASTASSFKFANGVEFSATNPQAPPLLTVNVPIGLQFGVNPGAITTNVQLNEDPVILDVDRGRTLALIGGDLRLQGDSALEAPGGRIELGSVGDNSFVSLTPTPGGFALGYEGVVNFRDIQLLGLETGVSVRTVSNGGGNIQVQSRRLTLDAGSVIEAGTEAAGSGGTVTVRATESIDINGSLPDGFIFTGIGATTSGTGNAGNVRIETGRLMLRDGAAIVTATLSAGKAGNVSINATQSVELSGTSSLISAGSIDDAKGDAGNVTIDTGQLIVRDGAVVATFSAGAGKAGNVSINATQSVEVSGTLGGILAGSAGTGDAGNVTINTPRLIVRDGATVGAATASDGNAGTVTINAGESVELIGTSTDGRIQSSLAVVSSGAGNAGNVMINTGQLIVREGAAVFAGTFSGNAGNITVNAEKSVELIGVSADGQHASLLAAATSGVGNAGKVTIQTGRLIVRDGAAVVAGTLGDGDAGNVTVNAGESVEVGGTSPDGLIVSQLSAATGSFLLQITSGITSGKGNAGNVSIETGRLIVRDGAQIIASTANNGNGGTVSINARDSVKLIGTSADGRNPSGLGAITTGVGNAGNVTIQTGRLIVRDGAGVLASSLGDGDAGNVTVNAGESVELIGISANGRNASTLGAITTGVGNAGNVAIQAGRLIIRDGADVTTATLGNGDAGNITINTSESVELIGTSADGQNTSSLFAISSVGTGDAGNVTINTRQLTVRDGASVLAGSALGRGNGGTITINAQRLIVQNGGISVGTFFSQGDAGTIAINASELVDLSATEQTRTLTASTGNGGNAGDVTIETGQLIVRDRAEINVNSTRFDVPQDQLTSQELAQLQQQGLTDLLDRDPGDPGSINITARSLRLDNQGSLNASSQTGNGGNITVRSQDIQLRRQSQFSAAGSPTGVTKEGSININTQSLVLLQGSSIITSANDPQGGSNIDITPRSDLGLALFLSPDSLINASGQLNIEGYIQPSNPNIPQIEVVDATNLIADPCAAARGGSSFSVTGRGGIPPSPDEALGGDAYLVDLVTIDPQVQGSRGIQEPRTLGEIRSDNVNSDTPITDIVEATGWYTNEKGEVVLIASTPTRYRLWQNPYLCK